MSNPRLRCFYRTFQINIKEGEQYRITGGTRTVFVFRNKRGLHISKGGYVKRRRKPK